MSTETLVLLILIIVINVIGVAYNIAKRRTLRCSAMIGRVLFCWRRRKDGSWFCDKHQDYLNDPECAPNAAPNKPLGALYKEPPREVWIVSSTTGPDHVAITEKCAMEHAALTAGEFPELGPFRVCRYVAEPLAANEAFLGNATTLELLNELRARAEMHGYGNYRTVDA